jgi:N-sulfoglucosamine sulfohydrolase
MKSRTSQLQYWRSRPHFLFASLNHGAIPLTRMAVLIFDGAMLSLRKYLRSALCVAGLLLLSTIDKTAVHAETAAKNDWNVLIILSEDHGSHLGCYGDTISHTPNLDQLAGEGVRFTNAYVPQATCSPSRASLLTGTYPQQHGQIGLSVTASHHLFLDHGLAEGIVPMPQLFQERGYRTGVMGKIHVNPHEALGFEFVRGSNSIGSSANSAYERDIITQHGQTERRRVRYSSDVEQMVEAAEAFFEECDGRPFFLYVATGDVHPANLHFQIDGYPERVHQPEFFADKPFPETGLSSLGEGGQRGMAAYYNGIDRLDVLVGKLLEQLYSHGHKNNTIVFFLSDHGPSFPGAGGRGKMSCYEGGLKVPFIMHWPEREFPAVFDGFVSSLDIMPTLLEAVGIDAPEYLPGKPLQYVLSGDLEPHQAIFGEYNRHTGLPPYGESFWPTRSVRFENLKLIHNALASVYHPLQGRTADDGPRESRGRRNQYLRHAETPEWEFYDLSNDPYEFDNRYDDANYAAEIAKLKQKLHEWQVSVDDFLLDPEEKAAEAARAEAIIQAIFN